MVSVEEKLKEITRHRNIKLVERGNSAILAALYIVKQINPARNKVLIPDQGGWITFKQYTRKFGFEVVKVKTDKGIIELKDLEAKSKDAAAFLVTSFAGYFAEQPIKEISKICRKSKCILIEDASGAIGDKTLCNGKYSDIIVGSFGKWKAVDLGTGGFISSNFDLEVARDLFNTIKFKGDEKKLLEKLNNSAKRIKMLMNIAENVKKGLEKEIKGINIFHKNKRGLNVVAGFKDEKEKESIINYCKRNKYEYVFCPKYIRVKENAISIEIKRIDTEEK